MTHRNMKQYAQDPQKRRRYHRLQCSDRRARGLLCQLHSSLQVRLLIEHGFDLRAELVLVRMQRVNEARHHRSFCLLLGAFFEGLLELASLRLVLPVVDAREVLSLQQ